jgi:hypothetical protein
MRIPWDSFLKTAWKEKGRDSDISFKNSTERYSPENETDREKFLNILFCTDRESPLKKAQMHRKIISWKRHGKRNTQMIQNEDPLQQARRENLLLTEWEKNSQTARKKKEYLSHDTEVTEENLLKRHGKRNSQIARKKNHLKTARKEKVSNVPGRESY